MEVPIWEKINLTIPEAAAMFNIGQHTIRYLSANGDSDFAIQVGKKLLINKERFDRYLLNHPDVSFD